MKQALKKVAGDSIYNKIVLPKHLGVAIAENIKHKFPAKGITVIGITGTNGKTSTAYMVHKMLVEAGYTAGLMTTVAHGVGNDLQQQIHHMTSQPIGQLLARLSDMKARGMDILVLEVTSHALSQFRTLGIPIDIAVMTNLTHEHLDYHGSFKAYRSAKVKLFKAASRHKSGRRLGIVNSDDDNAVFFADAVPNVMGYSLHKSDDENVIYPQNLKMTGKGSSYDVTLGSEVASIKCHLPGEYNVANSLAAIAVGRALDLTTKQIERGIDALKSVEGRMMTVDEGQNFDVIVDYAHTPDSYEKLLSNLRPVAAGRLICLFGSAGRRDEAKRAIQGRIAGKYCDVLVLTEEDDRDVDGSKILNQIESGGRESGKTTDIDMFKVPGREEAIAFALKTAKAGDTVLLLGKGHEKTIERAIGSGGTKDPNSNWEEFPWDEVALTKKLLKTLN